MDPAAWGHRSAERVITSLESFVMVGLLYSGRGRCGRDRGLVIDSNSILIDLVGMPSSEGLRRLLCEGLKGNSGEGQGPDAERWISLL